MLIIKQFLERVFVGGLMLTSAIIAFAIVLVVKIEVWDRIPYYDRKIAGIILGVIGLCWFIGHGFFLSQDETSQRQRDTDLIDKWSNDVKAYEKGGRDEQ